MKALMRKKKVKVPKLVKLRTKRCSVEELQTALVTLVELHNKLVKDINDLIESGRILSKQKARELRHYGL